MQPAWLRRALALAFQVGALGVLVLALLGAAWLDPRTKPRVLVLVDRSDSVPRAAADQVFGEVMGALGDARVERIEFAGRPSPAAPAAPGAGLDPTATDIAAAIEAGLAAHAAEPFALAVVISDGHATQGDTAGLLAAARDASLPLSWAAVGAAAPDLRIAEVLAPRQAVIGQPIDLTVRLMGAIDSPLRVRATARSAGGDAQQALSDTIRGGAAALRLEPKLAGPLLVDLIVEDPASGRVIDSLPDAAAIAVAPRAPILYARGSPGALAGSLIGGGWVVNVVPAVQLDAQADSLDAYRAVILDDVAVSDSSGRFWRALAQAVRDRGVGLMVLGGERSFTRGGYRGSVLEALLPVSSVPGALDRPAAVVFAVDKSGSMGPGSGGVDRFRLAQRAVIDTARGLSERDALGLMVFDVEPRVLIPLGPAPLGNALLERDWRATPNGGTRLAPALDAAIETLERSSAQRRLLVLVTDGFVDEAPLDSLRARLQRARIETVVMAVGPDADANALERMFPAGAAEVLRVDQAAELPQVMRSALERRRARIERGTIGAEQREDLPFAPARLEPWPGVVAHHVTRLEAGAAAAVRSERGDPLIAFWRQGNGRVVAVTSGLGAWAPRWLRWSEWPRLAGGLTAWVSGISAGESIGVEVSEAPTALRVDFDLPSALRGAGDVRVTADTPAGKVLPLRPQPIAPGRVRAELPEAGPGLYVFVVSTPIGVHRHQHLRSGPAERRTWGISPAIEQWKAAGLVRDWDGAALGRRRGADLIDRSLIALALALALAGIVADRARFEPMARAMAIILRRR
jgi:Mg-chelatase subunit ChlD